MGSYLEMILLWTAYFPYFALRGFKPMGLWGHLPQGWVPGARAGFVWKWGCPIGRTGWWKIYREGPRTNLSAMAGRARCKEPDGKQWEKKQRCQDIERPAWESTVQWAQPEDLSQGTEQSITSPMETFILLVCKFSYVGRRALLQASG